MSSNYLLLMFDYHSYLLLLFYFICFCLGFMDYWAQGPFFFSTQAGPGWGPQELIAAQAPGLLATPHDPVYWPQPQTPLDALVWWLRTAHASGSLLAPNISHLQHLQASGSFITNVYTQGRPHVSFADRWSITSNLQLYSQPSSSPSQSAHLLESEHHACQSHAQCMPNIQPYFQLVCPLAQLQTTLMRTPYLHMARPSPHADSSRAPPGAFQASVPSS